MTWAVPVLPQTSWPSTLALPPTQELLRSADVVIAVGTELAETDSWVDRLPIAGRLIRIDIDPATLSRDYPAEIAILADGASVLTALLDAGYGGRVARVASEDSFVPLGDAARHVLVSEDAVEQAPLGLLDR